MGYTTDFNGKFELNKKLSEEDHKFLTKFAESRRMARNVDPKYGVEGEFYVDGSEMFGQGKDSDIINYNQPPKTQPSLWCQWVPTKDGMGLEWDGGEKFYNYIEWLQYIIENILKPRGYVLNGEVYWYGEDNADTGVMVVVDNVVSTRAQGDDGVPNTRVFFVTDGPYVSDGDAQNEELHETLEAAEKYAEGMMRPRIRVCIVRNAYREDDGTWNYEDHSDTFETVKVIKQ
jgi:hypothetical protein